MRELKVHFVELKHCCRLRVFVFVPQSVDSTHLLRGPQVEATRHSWLKLNE